MEIETEANVSCATNRGGAGYRWSLRGYKAAAQEFQNLDGAEQYK
jgi:hypothetical protein